MEEKDNLFNSITKKLDRMREEHTIQPSVATQLESAINLHLGNKEERENLHTIITGANPKFVSTLTKRHPALNEYYVKLSIFIYIGMDNKQIAKMLMVRPESINQSRWRLRGKLGLCRRRVAGLLSALTCMSVSEFLLNLRCENVGVHSVGTCAGRLRICKFGVHEEA